MSPKKLLALSAVVVVLFGFIFFFERKMPTTEERARKGDLYWDIPQDSVQKIEIVRGAETLEFQRAGTGWKMVRPEKYPADAFAVGSVLTDLAAMRRAGGEDAAEGKSADYGLEKPAASATLVWSDPSDPKTLKSRTVEFGAAVPGTDVVAARVTGTQKILFVPSSVVTGLKKSTDDFESRELFGALAADATKLEILRGRGKLVFVRKDHAWWLSEPVSDLAEGSEVDRFVGTLSGLRAKDFVHGTQDLAAIGLNPPLYRVSLTGAPKTPPTSVDFGATRTDGNTVYALREGQVLTVDRDIADELSKEAEAFRSRTLLGFNRADVVSIEAAFPKASYLLTQKDGGWSSGSRPVLAGAAEDLMTALLDVKVRDFLDEAGSKGLPLPVATVTVRSKASPNWTLSLYPRNSQLVARATPRPNAFVVDRDTPEKLEAAVKKAVAAAPVPAPAPSPVSRKP
ncbi:MAG: DUF4340 domain-containing protein [Syntrophomonadaceae bacterium]